MASQIWTHTMLCICWLDCWCLILARGCLVLKCCAILTWMRDTCNTTHSSVSAVILTWKESWHSVKVKTHVENCSLYVDHCSCQQTWSQIPWNTLTRPLRSHWHQLHVCIRECLNTSNYWTRTRHHYSSMPSQRNSSSFRSMCYNIKKHLSPFFLTYVAICQEEWQLGYSRQ